MIFGYLTNDCYGNIFELSLKSNLQYIKISQVFKTITFQKPNYYFLFILLNINQSFETWVKILYFHIRVRCNKLNISENQLQFKMYFKESSLLKLEYYLENNIQKTQHFLLFKYQKDCSFKISSKIIKFLSTFKPLQFMTFLVDLNLKHSSFQIYCLTHC